MVKTSIISTGEYAGGIAVIISGAESALLMTLSHEQQIQIDDLISRLILNAGVNGQKLGKLTLVTKD